MPPDNGDRQTLKRRTVLSMTAAAAGTTAIGAFAGSAAAWDTPVNVSFRGCTEAWFVFGTDALGSDGDLNRDLRVKIVVDDGGSAACVYRTPTPQNVETIPGQCGDQPIYKFVDPQGRKLLAAQTEKGGGDAWNCLHVNEHTCANTPGTPDPTAAACVDMTEGVCADYDDPACPGQNGPPNGGGPPNGNGPP